MTIRVRCAQWGQFVELEVDNVSEGGLFIRTMTPAGLRTMVDLALPGPAGRPESVLAEVVHVVAPERAGGCPGMGVQFITVTPGARAALQALLAAGQPERPSSEADRQAPAISEQQEPTAAVAPQHAEVLAELRSVVGRLRECGDFERLGLSPGADVGAARRAFRQLSKRYHPDRFGRYGSAEIKAVAQELFLIISEAEKAIRKGRVTTDRHRRPPTPASPVVVTGISSGGNPQPPRARRAGAGSRERVSASRVAAMRRRAMRSSPDQRPVTQTDVDDISSLPTEAVHRRGLAAMREGRYDTARDLFAEAVKRSPYLVDYQVAQCLALGYLSERRGEIERAIAHFHRARTLDPACDEATQRLIALDG